MTEQAALSVSGIILAGGESSRLGRDKASTLLNGRPLLQWVGDKLSAVAAQIVVVKAAGQKLPGIDVPVPVDVVQDIFPGRGPLGGLYTGLKTAVYDLAIAVACDMPLLSVPLLRALVDLAPGYDVIMPTRDGRPQPLHAVYRKTCVEAIERELAAGNLKVVSFLPVVRVLSVGEEVWRKYDAEGESFTNVNTEDDLKRIGKLLA